MGRGQGVVPKGSRETYPVRERFCVPGPWRVLHIPPTQVSPTRKLPRGTGTADPQGVGGVKGLQHSPLPSPHLEPFSSAPTHFLQAPALRPKWDRSYLQVAGHRACPGLGGGGRRSRGSSWEPGGGNQAHSWGGGWGGQGNQPCPACWADTGGELGRTVYCSWASVSYRQVQGEDPGALHCLTSVPRVNDFF